MTETYKYTLWDTLDMEEKKCKVCGYRYKDGANITTIMNHIRKEHMGDED